MTMSDTDLAVAGAGRRARGGGGSARRAERTAVSLDTAKFIQRNIPNFEILNEEALQIIEWNAETVLEEIGVNFVENPEALKRWKDAGADVQGERVRIPRGLARKLCGTAPKTFTQHARNPARNVEIGGRNLVLAPVYGPPFVSDREGGRRYATIEDFRNFVKLGYMSKWLHHSGGTVCEPTDVPVNKRHLDMLHAHMVLSDKPYMGSVTEPSRALVRDVGVAADQERDRLRRRLGQRQRRGLLERHHRQHRRPVRFSRQISVIDIEPRQVEEPRHPGDHADHVSRLDPPIPVLQEGRDHRLPLFFEKKIKKG